MSAPARLGLVVVLTIAAVLLLSASAAAAKTIHVVERPNSDKITNGSEEDAEGNILTFHNKVYDAANRKQVGHDAGYCIRMVVGKSWECSWTTYLAGGAIMVQGPFSDTGSSVLAITGGTGAYATARGTMTLKYRNKKGTAFDFIFHLK